MRPPEPDLRTLPPSAPGVAADFDAEDDELRGVPGELCAVAWSPLPFDPQPAIDSVVRVAMAAPTSERFTEILPSGLAFFILRKVYCPRTSPFVGASHEVGAIHVVS